MAFQQRIFVASATSLLVSTLIVGVLGGALNSAAASDTFHFATPTIATTLAPVTPVTTPVPVEPVTPVVKPVPVVPTSPTPTPVATTLPIPAATVSSTLTFSPLMMPVAQPPQQARTTVNAATPAYDQTQSMPMQAAVNPQNVN